jgi:hypothetical protein
VAFVDGDKWDGEPKHFLFSPYVQIIVASLLESTDQRWIKQAGNVTHITKLATSLWVPRELFLTGLVLAFLLPTLDRFIPLGYSFILMTSLSIYLGSRPRILASIPVNALMHPTL